MFFAMLIGSTAQAQQATTYDEAIIYANKKLADSKLLDAKAYYQQALKMKPGDEYSNKQINTIVERMKSAMAAEDEYYDIIDFGDELYDQNKLDLAIDQYKRAIELVPNDEYALGKIREIQEFQNNEKDKIESFDRFMEAGKVYLADERFDKAIEEFSNAAGIFPDKDSPITELAEARRQKQDYKERETRYNAKFEEANRYFLVKNFGEALKLYQEAEAIMPEKTEVKDKINQLIPLADKEVKFNIIIEKADEYYINQDFISARKEYLSASDLWPEKSYPGDMIAKINEKLAGERADLDKNYNEYIASGDSMMQSEEYSLALGKYNLALNLKPDESYPKSKIVEIESFFANQEKVFEENYQAIIASADSAFNASSYTIALNKYQSALEIKPDDNYPKNQIAEIDKLSAQIAAAEKLNNEYNSLIQTADNLYNTANYELSIEKYQEAQTMKPKETYPGVKINEIDQLLTDAEAMKKLNEEYNAIILLAEKQFSDELFAASRKSYEDALVLKPAEQLPVFKIKSIDSIVLVREKEAETKKQFDVLVAEGDALKESKEYELAITKYDEALVLIPNEINASQKKQSVIDIQEEIRRAAELQKRYDDAISKGDELFTEGSFELSKVEFEKARAMKSKEEYPRKRLSDIAEELKRLEAEKEQRYAESIASADVFFDQGQYDKALKKYQLASSIKPSETHPRQRITECDRYIAERNAMLMEEYKIAVAEADKLHNAKAYDKAIMAFRKAQTIKPDETYPQEMIDQISKFIEENSIVDIISSSDTVTMGMTDKFQFEPVKINVRKSNYIFLRAKNIGDKTTKLIFSYGSNASKNGGFVVQVIEGEEFNDYIIRVGNQYKWFSEDNNWFTIHPENGDVEISLLRISKGY